MAPAARRADRVITVSETQRSRRRAAAARAAVKIDVVPNGIVRRRGGEIVPAALPDGGRRVALSVATNVAHKALGELLAALATLPAGDRPMLVLAGHGTEQLAGEAARLGVRGTCCCSAPCARPSSKASTRRPTCS